MKDRKQSPSERTIKFIIISVVIVALSASASLSNTPRLVWKVSTRVRGGIKKKGAVKERVLRGSKTEGREKGDARKAARRHEVASGRGGK